MNDDHANTPCPVGFDAPVPDSGYRWWYLDGVSHDGAYGIVIIAFVGSVFSPYYFRARQKGPTPAEDYSSINVCLYRPGGDRWAMTERNRSAVTRDARSFRVARSRLAWEGDRFVAELTERSAPFGRRIEGRVELIPRVLNPERFPLDTDGRHTWHPVAPLADIHVEFDRPGLSWDGHGYFDMNFGSRMLELDFRTWDWSRSAEADGTSIYYVARSVDGDERRLGMRFGIDGSRTELDVPPPQTLPNSGWRVARHPSFTDTVSLARVLEDTPFYTRSLLADTSGGLHVHESLDMRRFSSPWVRTLLPFRMPRVA